jgi:hypothetical protein
MSNKFNIVAWNARSYNTQKLFIESYLYTHCPSVFAITETHIDSQSPLATNPPSFHDYVTLSYPHTKRSGGILIFIHIPGSPTAIIWLQLTLPNLPSFLLGLCYLHMMYTTRADEGVIIESNIQQACTYAFHVNNMPIMLAGDFNMHCSEWGQSVGSRKVDNNVYNVLTHNHFASLNALYQHGVKTFQNKTVIDLALCTDVNLIDNFIVDNNCTLHSDHLPIVIQLQSHFNHHKSTPPLKTSYNYQLAQWSLYQNQLQSTLSTCFDALYNNIQSTFHYDKTNMQSIELLFNHTWTISILVYMIVWFSLQIALYLWISIVKSINHGINMNPYYLHWKVHWIRQRVITVHITTFLHWNAHTMMRKLHTKTLYWTQKRSNKLLNCIRYKTPLHAP